MSELHNYLAHRAYSMRVDSLTMTTNAGSGHPTSALSAADIVAVLFFHVMRYELENPHNPNNDRFILSKGHASPILYAAYHALGVLSDKDLFGYRSFNSVLEGHPTPRFAWAEAATGSLGQGLSIGVGMALDGKMDKRDYRVYVLMGDSEVSEGSVWEAMELAAYNKLDNLIGIIDVNRLGQRGETMEGWDLGSYKKRGEAFGWEVFEVNGHHIDELLQVFDKAKSIKEKPVLILAKTQKGYGLEGIQNKNDFHGKAFSKEELPSLLQELAKKFSDAVKMPHYTPLYHAIKHENPPAVPKQIELSEPYYKIGELVPTRKAFGQALLALGAASEKVISIDAEVSNSTYAGYFAEKYPARFVEAFIAEQNMVGMGVGFAHMGKIPFCSTFAAFFTRAYDQIRMAAIGRSPLRLVGSHAGVSIGQDGPSQMGLEDIAMMRAIPDSVILYPSDAVSAYKLVEVMANRFDGISYLRTTRGATPVLYGDDEQFQIGGSRVIRQSLGDQAVIVGAGITLHEALKAYELLKKENIFVAVLDLYSIKPLDRHTLVTLGRASQGRMVIVEDHYQEGGIGQAVITALANEHFTIKSLAVTRLPRSGSPEDLMRYEGIDAAAIYAAVKELIH